MDKEVKAQLQQINDKLDVLLNIGNANILSDRPLNTVQAAQYLQISQAHLYALIYDGKLKPMQRRKHGRILFSKAQLETYLKTI